MSARAGLLLYGGDLIITTGAIEVIALVYGELHIFKDGDSDNVVGQRPQGRIDPDDEKYFARFESFAAENPAAMPQYRVAREATKAEYNIKPSLLVSPGSQLLLEGTKIAALVWQDGSSRVRVTPDFGDPIEFSSGTGAWIIVKVPPKADRLRIQLIDHPLQWTITMVSKTTIEQRAGGRSLGEGHAARLRWAHEILLAHPSRFADIRVTALSIVAEEAQRSDVNSEFARLVWLAARNGRLERQVSCIVSTSATAC